ncbi:SubName: Full=Uncharacterized protein {ECO:0000313/EMBL:CCA76488.1} [Serendipita indica DSM 11827]|nr:SubName: Full=Uncharacterized protein {ECO:0000313/EMBL:CCA76488.1} [Serendipita indica DSM 11827]
MLSRPRKQIVEDLGVPHTPTTPNWTKTTTTTTTTTTTRKWWWPYTHSLRENDRSVLPRSSAELSESDASSVPSDITRPRSPIIVAAPVSADSQNYSPLLLVILLFPLSTALVIGSLWTLPVRLPSAIDDSSTGSGEPHSVFPRTISDVRALAWALKGYSETGQWELVHVLAVLAVTALWKHAWSIPGSVLLNILTGTLLPPLPATLLQTLLTTLGSVLSTILATPLTPLLTRFFPSAIALTRSALEGSSNSTSRSSPWARLSVLRLIGIVPWSGINIACGVCGVSLWHCAVGAFIGTLPWTAVTCQIGDILQTIASTPTSPNSSAQQTISSVVTSPNTLFKLVFLTLVSLAPILAKDRLSRWLNGETAELDVTLSREREREREREKRGRGHKKRFSVEWWRRSLSMSRSKEAEDNVELLSVSPA